MSTVGIIGAGHLGAVLAKRLVRRGHGVQVANSRGPHSLKDIERDTGARAVAIADIASGVDVLILAIPLGRVRDLPKALFRALSQEVVIVDAGNYVPPRDGQIAEIDAGLPETAWVSDQLGRPVVKAFNNITEFSLEHAGKPKGAKNRIALPVAGDDQKGRAIVMGIVEDLGFSAFDAGPLASSWRQQIGQPAYCTDPTVEQLVTLLDRADPQTVAHNRQQSMELMAKMPADFPKADLVRAARFMVGFDRAKPTTWLALARLAFGMLGRRNDTSILQSQRRPGVRDRPFPSVLRLCGASR